ncbi:enoyl-CoA hydratase-related protein [Colwellia sp. 1_MG-2023]|uniref:enoyl-CoA hydratase-related protein n=1 Tax=unclassified Colwellia TaxID=196834 RepID=UPI001C08C7A5|nr:MULTISPECIES: enoyl-CoA hydratase-related protein [unclassified Colwellia]MBU2924061.1 enoyl-CoA hydratase/isomerase family protein [Colwellia sp. C2M11]MDO6651951.1 enoyl-CoA hydratase-related protein [Colwellia sp. 3_MG-2023]MDO6664727.1 enoyl-CoA hydratase-related protein [Colwellia sp. 2_MG-2023]MDO6689231.1 enoyl-CoA hydratase-related protein [Colwellia sp. 1_MG-2023]
MTDFIITKENNGVFIIILNRFEKKNALNKVMYQELCQHFDYAKKSEKINCILIRGNEKCFCAGNDLQDFIESAKGDALVALDFVKTLSEFNKPIIAAVAGDAVGIGTTLLLHCDMVIAANNAKFKLPFTQLGLCPEAGSSFLLTRLIGQNRAFELMVLGNTFSAEQALEYGIANQICSPDELLSISEKIANTIANLPSDAVMTSRKLIRQASQSQLSQVIENEGQEFSRLVNTPECKAILGKFFN